MAPGNARIWRHRRARRGVIRSAGALALIAVMSACGAHSGDGGGAGDGATATPWTPKPQETTPTPSPTHVPFTGTHWNIERLRLDDGVTAAPHGSAWLEFDGNGHVAGSLGCHRFKADATVDGRRVRIGEVRMSESSSSPPASGRGEQQQECSREQVTFEKYVKTILRSGLRADSGPSAEQLFLVNTRKDGFELQRGIPAPLIGTKWAVRSLYEGDSQAAPTDIAPKIGEVYVVFDGDGTVHGSLGCNDFRAKAEVAATAIEFSDPATTTHRECGDSIKAVEKQLLRVFREHAEYSLNHDALAVTTENEVPTQAGGFYGVKVDG